jgi:hypothetical protein
MKPLITSFKTKVLTCMSLSLASVRSALQMKSSSSRDSTILILILFNNHHSNNKMTIKVIAIHLKIAESLPQAILSASKWGRQNPRYSKIASVVHIKCLCQTMTRPKMWPLGQLDIDSVAAAIIDYLGSLTIKVSRKRNS